MQEYKQRYLYIFKMTDKTGSSNRSSSIDIVHIHSRRLIQPNKSEVLYANLLYFYTILTTILLCYFFCFFSMAFDRCSINDYLLTYLLTYISDSMTDITTIPTLNPSFLTSASSQKVSTSHYNIERQLEIAIRPPKPEIVTLLCCRM